MTKQWTYAPEGSAQAVASLTEELGAPYAALSRVLVQRGMQSIQDIKDWIPGIPISAVDPLQMAGMPQASARLAKARAQAESVMLFGDYDVDGTTAVSVGKLALERGGWSILTHIPDRYKEGYGLSEVGIQRALDSGVKLLIALDCGIKSNALIASAQERGLDIIVADHHTPGDTLPPAIAVLDPKRKDCPFPHKELSGCGVGYMLWRASYQEAGLDPSDLDDLMDLVAVSIGADMVPLIGLNRAIVRAGLASINQHPRPSLAALLSARPSGHITLQDVVFAIGPRINAAGRMHHGHLAVDLLTEGASEVLEQLSQDIEAHNVQRRSTEQGVSLAAQAQAMLQSDQLGLVLLGTDWHKGVLGIVAQRTVEAFYKPTIVLTEHEGKLSGSARSVPGLDLYDCLDEASEHLIQFGGHRAAAGMTLLPEKLADFQKAFNTAVERRWPEEQRQPYQKIDTEAAIHELHDGLAQLLERLEPFGMENEAPIWGLENVELQQIQKLSEGKHLKAIAHDPRTGARLPVIGFGWGHLDPQGSVNLAVVLEWNIFRGNKALQARILDIQF
ncbi:MAG: single-stranded-DNA-specific exonuclease RecJ [Schleiferiaceae bacterium]|nr:single-stranded-DNA-specific exonuclease RecJ [Schleiferiaceae bacterium]